MLTLADSGAQMVVISPKHAALLGIKETEDLSIMMAIQVADNRTIRVLGMAILKMTTNRMTCGRSTLWRAMTSSTSATRHFGTSAAFQRITPRRR